MSLYKPGDIVVVSFPFTDLSKAKSRPALIISNSRVNNSGDYILIQITSRDRQDIYSIPIKPEDYIGKALPLTSYIRVHKIFTLHEGLIQYCYTHVSREFRQKIVREISRNIA